jgi:cysteine desulfurase
LKAYLDNAATTGVSEQVFKAMEPYFLTNYGNPSSLHDMGIMTRKVINTSKKKIAELLHCDYKEIHFTSCGTESINWAIKGIAFSNKVKNEIITTRIEHHATLHTVNFLEQNGYVIHYVDVDEMGFIKLNHLQSLLNENTLLVSIIMGNNEIGTLQNIKEISKLCNQSGTYLHVDAVQVLTHVPLDLSMLNADLVSFSGHKFHAPKGIGILYIKHDTKIENLIHGGQQEYGLRSGTENVPYIVGITEAIVEGYKHLESNMIRLNDYAEYFINELDKSGIPYKLNGPNVGPNRLPGNINISIQNMDGHELLYELNKQGVFASTGSACDSENILPSHVLKALQVSDEYINGSLRFSIGDTTTFEEVQYSVKTLINIVKENL